MNRKYWRETWPITLALALAILTGCEILFDKTHQKDFPTAVSATVRYMPEMGILEIAPVCDDIQSTYFKTTDDNREFRRGIFEFKIPEFKGTVTEAKLIFMKHGAWIAQPVPPDVHNLSYYPADSQVTIDDYNRSATFLASFETDANDTVQQVLSFDLTSIIDEFSGKELGFRIELALDTTYSDDGSLGTGFIGDSVFDSLYAARPRIKLIYEKE